MTLTTPFGARSASTRPSEVKRPIAAFIIVIATFCACRGDDDKDDLIAQVKDLPPALLAASANPSVASLRPYPRASWRLTDTPRRAMVIAASHILISFNEASKRAAWPLFVASPSSRTIDQAFELVNSLARQLVDSPQRFGEFANSSSDDVTTAEWGGRLGVFRGDQVPEEILDVLSTLKPGAITEFPVRSELGFHIFRRDSLPPAFRASFARLLIGHIDSRATGELLRKPTRSRSEAKQLIDSLAHQIQTAPNKFAGLARSFSDSADALRDGDLGELGSYERTTYPIRLAVTQPTVAQTRPSIVETALGFEMVIRRAPPEGRAPIAAARILIADRGTPSELLCHASERTRDEARTLAVRVAALASRSDDGSFSSLRDQYCDACPCLSHTWQSGRGDPRIEHALKGVPVDRVVGPIETPIGIVILRKERESLPPVEPAEELFLGIPNPPITSVEQAVTLMDGPALAFHARRVAEYIRDAHAARLSEKERRGVMAAYEALATAWETRAMGRWPKARHEALQQWRKQLVAAVGAQKAVEIEQHGNEWILSRARVSPNGPR